MPDLKWRFSQPNITTVFVYGPLLQPVTLGRFITLERWKRRCSQRDERGLRQIWSQIRCLPISVGQKRISCYGNSPKYNKFFIEQLTELLSNYGEIHEVWFDGACGEGPNGKKNKNMTGISSIKPYKSYNPTLSWLSWETT